MSNFGISLMVAAIALIMLFPDVLIFRFLAAIFLGLGIGYSLAREVVNR